MFIDCTKLPDPTKPQRDDLYVSLDRQHTLVVLDVPKHAREDETGVISFVLNGLPNACPRRHLLGILTSIGARPWGRLDRSDAGRPALTRDPELVAQRLQAIGPHLRALREQYGLSMGDLAGALGCAGARLSMLELAQPDLASGAGGVREDEGRAALAAVVVKAALVVVGHSEDEMFEVVHHALSTDQALAAISTIASARAKATAAQGTGAWHRDEPALDRGPFRVGDRVIYKEMEARIAELDTDLGSAMLQRPSGEHLIAPFTDLVLANETVDVQTARAGLAHLVAGIIGEMEWGEEAQESMTDAWIPTLEQTLASDEAQRLIRLHG